MKWVKGQNLRGNGGETPVKGVHYFTTDEVETIKKEIATELATKIPEIPEAIKVDQELVRKIVQIMHSLPETDKLEVSKGIRNASSFIYGGTKYKTSELMHGAGSGGGTGLTILPATGAVDNSNVVFTFTSTPIMVVVNGSNYRNGHGVTIVGTTATLDSPVGTNGDIYGL